MRIVGVMDRHLSEREWFAGNAYSIADMAVLPWVDGIIHEPTFADRTYLKAWADTLLAKPAVRRGLDVERENVRQEVIEGGMKGFDDEHRSQLFGEKQHNRNS